MSNNKVAYIIDPKIGDIELADDHVMRPFRLKLTHALLTVTGVLPHLEVYESTPAPLHELATFHTLDYLEFLKDIGQYTTPEHEATRIKYDVLLPTDPGGKDCPLFLDVWDYVTRYCGSTLLACRLVSDGQHRVSINWSGGMHHAKASSASGFCYVNDIVVGINLLLEKFQRVMYIDIDVHHGDGVEAAYHGNQRVLTLSLHQYGAGFFPGTGALEDTQGTTVNVPLWNGTNDQTYLHLFGATFGECISAFDPEAIVLQCGADTIAGDRLGGLNVSTQAYIRCVMSVLSLGKPTVLLGGGGYNVAHTARCWALTTAAACGVLSSIPYFIPFNEYSSCFEEESSNGPCPLHVIPTATKSSEFSLDSSFMRRAMVTISEHMRRLRLTRFGTPYQIVTTNGNREDDGQLVTYD